MPLHGLKINIVIHIAFLLLMAMLFVGFVLVSASQKNNIRSEISKGTLALALIERKLIQSADQKNPINGFLFGKYFDQILDEVNVSHVLIIKKNVPEVYFRGSDEGLKKRLKAAAEHSLRSGEKTREYFGEMWGVFWKESQYAILSAPLYRDGKIVAALSIGLSFEEIYETLRRTQKTLFSFILGYTAILTLIGASSLSRIITKPLNRLVDRAEEYRDDSSDFFLYEKEGGEFVKLSAALNRMLSRISADRRKLKETVHSLEMANEKLAHAQKDVIRAEKLASVGRISSGIAHEIGNPIGIVIGYLELLKQIDITDEERNEFIQRADREINRINTIIRQLLDFGKPSTAGYRVFSVHEIISETLNVLTVQPVMKNINMKHNFAAENDSVMADPDQLRQVFLNLILNAGDAIFSAGQSDRGEIEIATMVETLPDSDTGKAEPSLKISISDNGTGIAAENIDNIFDPFYTTKKAGKGTGLGLWVSFLILEDAGGTILASSEENEGTIITVNLPLYSENERRALIISD
ncbi:ATP-binding protein [Thermodesulfobacteriota bacterium]